MGLKKFFYEIKNHLKYGINLPKIPNLDKYVAAAIIFVLVFATYRVAMNMTKSEKDNLATANTNLEAEMRILEEENKELRELLKSAHRINQLNSQMYNELVDLYNNRTNSNLQKARLPEIPSHLE